MGVPGNANALLLRSAAAAGGYQASRSLRFNSSDSASLSRASYAGSGTFSCWVKRCKLGTAQTIMSGVAFNASDQLNSSTAVFRDPSAWMHVLVSTSGTYVNGTSVASGSAITPGIIGSGCDLYLADIHFIDGQALTPSSFAETNATTGQWVPKAYTGSYGTNGFKLTFSDNSNNTATTLGKDYSGNGNNWTPTNLSVAAGAGNDSLVDTPTSYGTDTGMGGEVRGNYATMNPLQKGTSITVSNGNLDVANTALVDNIIVSTIGMTSGKWYFEVTITNLGGGEYAIGFGKNPNLNSYIGSNATTWAYADTGKLMTNGVLSNYGSSYATGDVLGAAFDGDNGTLVFYKNGVSQGTAATGLTAGPYFFLVDTYNAAATRSVNFGQRAFSYQAPSGYKCLVDTNLPSPVIAKPNTVMDVKLITANNSTQVITGLAFSPDLVWTKSRSNAFSHYLYDTVRGVQKPLISNATNAEATITTSLTSFNSDGFTLGADDGANYSSGSGVAWTWDAGTSTVTNNVGSITSQVRANASAGFSIVTYTGNGTAGATVGHGLGVTPSLIIVKDRTTTRDWLVYSKEIGNTKYLALNSTIAAATFNLWNNTTPTSSVFSLSSAVDVNSSSSNYVAYCFAPVSGYSSMGSYVANGSSNGPFQWCGFRPGWVMLKRSDSTESWIIIDAARDTYNLSVNNLFANLSNAEQASASIDILSNGFKLRSTTTGGNTSGGTYVWAAFAESPFQYARAR